MKKQKINPLNFLTYIFLCVLVISSVMSVRTATVQAAEAASLSFSPHDSQIDAGKTLSVKVHLDTGGEAVNVIQADITYPLNIFDPAKSNVKCQKPFPTAAQQVVNSTIGSKGLIKAACAVAVNSTATTTPFKGEADVALINLKVRSSAPSLHDANMLAYVMNTNVGGGTSVYSGVARASDSANILGNVQNAEISIKSKNNNYSAHDVNNDMEVNMEDLSLIVSNFGIPLSRAPNLKADVNGDHKIDIFDLSILLSSQQ
jgi:hypothetical protein